MDPYLIEKGFQRVYQLFKETGQQFKATDTQFREITDEFERKFKQITNDNIQKTQALMVSEKIYLTHYAWFMDLLTASAVRVLRKTGLKVDTSAVRIAMFKPDTCRPKKIDLLCWGRKTVVAFKVKSCINIEDIGQHEQYLNDFFQFFPEFSDMTLYAGIAGLDFQQGCRQKAFDTGLYVLGLVDDNQVCCLTSDDFKPRKLIMQMDHE